MTAQSPTTESRSSGTTVTDTAAAAAPPAGHAGPAELQAEEILVEEISIDGMCGVY